MYVKASKRNNVSLLLISSSVLKLEGHFSGAIFIWLMNKTGRGPSVFPTGTLFFSAIMKKFRMK
jgi:hypothetical protein